MKRILVLLIVILAISSSNSFASKDKITLVVDNEVIETDVDPIAINGRTLVPLRAIVEGLGARVFWNEEGSDPNDVFFNFYDSILETDIKELSISNGSKDYVADGKKGTMDVGPRIIRNRTMVPIRFIAELLGLGVYWDAEERIVEVYAKTPEEVNRGIDLVQKALKDTNPYVGIMSQGEEELNGETYYVFSAAEDHDTHIVTLGWYYVSLERGHVYEQDMANLELTLIYSENKNLDEKIKFKDKGFEEAIRNEIGNNIPGNAHKGDIHKSDVIGITSLTCWSENAEDIKSIEGIENLINLEGLTIYGVNVSDLSPISSLTKLEILEIFGSKVNDLNPISNLTNLQHLSVYDTSLIDLLPIKNLTNLDHLNLINTNTKDISNLKYLTNLTYLNISGNNITDISSLKNLRNLDRLVIAGNNVSDIRPLTRLISLERLDLEENQINDLTAIKNLRNLEYLTIDRNPIDNLAPLASLRNLDYLIVDNNKVSELKTFENLINTKINIHPEWPPFES